MNQNSYRKFGASLLLVLMVGFIAIQWKQTQTVLERADRIEARYASLLNLMPAAFVVCDEEGIITTISYEAEQILGWPARELVGGSIKVIMDEEAAADHETARRMAVDKLKSYRGSYVLDRTLHTDQAHSMDGRKLRLRIHMRGVCTNGNVEFISIIVPQTPRNKLGPLFVDPSEFPAGIPQKEM